MTGKPIYLLPLFGLLFGCQASAPTRVAQGPEFYSSQAGLSSLPLSEAVRAGDFLYLSGQLGTVPGSKDLAPGGVGPESAQALDNIQAILARHGATMDDLVKCTVFLADIKEWPAFNDVYRTRFPHHFPARSAFATNGLALGGRVEIECFAYAPTAHP